MAKIGLAEAVRRHATIDRATLAATTEDDIRRHMIEDGYDPDAAVPAECWRVVRPPHAIRERFGLTRERFAALIGVLVAIDRNWEQCRTALPSGIRALFDTLDCEPEAAKRALSQPATAA